MAPTPDPGRDKLHGLQALRFLAALMVVVAHALPTAFPGGAKAAGFPDAERLGGFGVGLFFVISGFIMVHASRRDFGRPGAPSAFARRRLVRIVPLYWFATTLMLATTYLGSGGTCPDPSAAHVLASYLFIATMRCDGDIQPLLQQGWTLNYEMLFYLVFGCALVLRTRAACAGVALVLGALVACGALTKAGDSGTIWGFYTDPILLLFVAGLAVGLLYGTRGPIAEMPFSSLLLTAPLAIASVYVLDALADFPALRFSTLVIATLLAVAVAAWTRSPPEAGVTRALDLMGDASYSIYLMHVFALTAVRKLWAVAALPAWPAAYLALASMGALAVGLVVHLAVERPLLRWLRGRTGAPPVSAEFRA